MFDSRIYWDIVFYLALEPICVTLCIVYIVNAILLANCVIDSILCCTLVYNGMCWCS